MDRERIINGLERGVAGDRQFLGTPREVAALPEQEPFNLWRNIVDFYGMEGIQEFFTNMFRKEQFEKRSPSVNPSWGKENIREVSQILRD